jgi:hypothetical protein
MGSQDFDWTVSHNTYLILLSLYISDHNNCWVFFLLTANFETSIAKPIHAMMRKKLLSKTPKSLRSQFVNVVSKRHIDLALQIFLGVVSLVQDQRRLLAFREL